MHARDEEVEGLLQAAADVDFVLTEEFEGARKGFVFTTRKQGLGYYKDWAAKGVHGSCASKDWGSSSGSSPDGSGAPKIYKSADHEKQVKAEELAEAEHEKQVKAGKKSS
jgi:hypothetical protein